MGTQGRSCHRAKTEISFPMSGTSRPLNTSPNITIVTPCLNSERTIRATIESVLSQEYRDWEHWVLDGGSTDATPRILAEYPHLRWVSETDAGNYDAMNKGIARARGEWIVILNADDCFRQEALSTVARAITQHPEWDALFGDVVYVDAAGREIYRRAEARYDYRVLLYAVDYVCHQTLFVRRHVYQRLGGYRQQEFRSSADYEFKLRLGREHCPVGHVPHFLVNYRYHQHGQSADRRLIHNSIQEAEAIKRAYGNSGGWAAPGPKLIYKVKRQLQKLWHRGRCDLVPGKWKLRPHLREQSQFSSNSGLDRLSPP